MTLLPDCTHSTWTSAPAGRGYERRYCRACRNPLGKFPVDKTRTKTGAPAAYKVTCVSLYHDDIQRIEGMVRRAKAAGFTQVNRSEVIRAAVKLMADHPDFEKVLCREMKDRRPGAWFPDTEGA